jgi:Putative adhesin
LRSIVLTLLFLALALPVAASEGPRVQRGTPRREGRFWSQLDTCFVPVKPGGRLILRTDLGTVTVVPGADSDRLQCEVKLLAFTASDADAHAFFSHAALTARRAGADGADVELRLPRQDQFGSRLGAFFSIQVPRQFNLDVQTQAGAIQVAGLNGDLRASTAIGDIRSGDLTGSVRLQTSGNINLGSVGQRLEARSAGGSIRVGDVKGDAYLETNGGDIVAGMVSGSVNATTGAGDIVLRGASGAVTAQTAGGQIQLGQCGSTVRAESGAGSIHLDGARGRVEAQTGGGSIDLLQVMSAVRADTTVGDILAQIDAGREAFGASTLRSSMGDVHVFLPPDLPVTVNAVIQRGIGHVIASDFPLTERRQNPGDPGLALVQGVGALDGGGPQLSLRTTMGSIEIRKEDAQAMARVKACQLLFWRAWQQQAKEQEESLQFLRQAMEEQAQRLEQMQRVFSEANGQQ